MARPALWLTAIMLFAAATLPAQTLPEIKFEKYVLPNGLNVILYVDHTVPAVTVNTWYHVGSKNEKHGRTGFAHLFEHLMFEGSVHHPTDFTPWMESVGGNNNASTTADRTNYIDTVPSNQLEKVLWLESDRMGFLPPAITQEKLDVQRDVVKNERRQSIDNQPYAKVDELESTALYPPEHPYSWSVIGSMEDLSAASLDDIKSFFKQYYVPSNASLCLAGDFDPAQAKQLIEKYYASLPAGDPIDRMKSWIPNVSGIKRVTAEDRVSLARFYCVWPTPARYTPGDAELSLFANALASGKTSRLYKALVYDQQIALDVSAYQYGGELSGSFNIEVTAKEGHSLDEIERAVDAVLKSALEKGITAQELKDAQTGYEAGFVRSLQRAGSLADRLNNYNTFLGDPGRFQWDLDRYTKATVPGVMQWARRYVDLNNRVIVDVVPQASYTAEQSTLDRSVEPSAGAEPDFTVPDVQQDSLSNGLKIYLVEKHSLPLVQVNYVLKSGWASDPKDKPGSARLTAELLDEGTTTRSSLQISEEAKAIGAMLGTSSSFDGSFITLNALKRNLDRGLELMSDVLLHPTFPAEELERQRAIYLGRIQQESRQPGSVASKVFQRLMYGADHPYSQPSTGSGTVASVQAITRDDLVTFYRTQYFARDAVLVVVGDITMREAKAGLEKAMKGWRPQAVSRPEIPAPAPVKGTTIYLVDKPGAPQSVVMAGHLGVQRSDPDYVILDVVNNALGGQFSSRLNTNLREEKGYTYGAHSYFSARRGQGPFLVQANVQTQFTGNTVSEIIKELNSVVGDKPIGDQELTASKENLIKGYPQDFETFTSLAGQLNNVAVMDLPVTEWSSYVQRVSGVSTQDADRAARQHLHPSDLLIVVVGDREKVEADLRALNVGEVKVTGLKDLQL